MDEQAAEAPVEVAPEGIPADSAARIPEFPRYMYRADGTAEIFTSEEAFKEQDDGNWATTLLAFGIETAPGAA